MIVLFRALACARSSSVFANIVPKKQSNIRILRKYCKRNHLAISFEKSGDVMS